MTANSEGTEALCATDRGFIYRVRTLDLAKILHCENHVDSVLHLTYPPNGSDKFASSSEDGTIRLWDIGNDYVVFMRFYA